MKKKSLRQNAKLSLLLSPFMIGLNVAYPLYEAYNGAEKVAYDVVMAAFSIALPFWAIGIFFFEKQVREFTIMDDYNNISGKQTVFMLFFLLFVNGVAYLLRFHLEKLGYSVEGWIF